MKDGALVMDAVAQLPENAIFKYRLKTFDLQQLQGAAVQDGQRKRMYMNEYNDIIYTYLNLLSLSRYIVIRAFKY